jgi:hypothetical protein
MLKEIIGAIPTVEKTWWQSFIERGTIESTTGSPAVESLVWKYAKDLLIKVNPYVKTIAVIVCIGGLLFYLVGVKKGINYTTGSLMGYTIYKVIVSVIL